MVTSASPGGSYGSEIPVNWGISIREGRGQNEVGKSVVTWLSSAGLQIVSSCNGANLPDMVAIRPVKSPIQKRTSSFMTAITKTRTSRPTSK